MSSATRPSRRQTSERGINTLTITVLCGGPSLEREVSLESGQAVAQALGRLGHRVRVADIHPGDLGALSEPADLVFIAMHGTFGEDGQLQALLEARELVYVGSDARSSALAMNKALAKECFTHAGVPTPDHQVVRGQDILRAAASWPLPAVVKPVDQGSSVDTTIVRRREELHSAFGTVVHKHGSCLLERCIEGPELTVGILAEQALPVCEIRTPREFYDYQAKYHEDSTQYLFDIDLPTATLVHVQDLCLKAHRALGCRDFSRVDCMIDRASGLPYILEVNTIPGFTNHSLLPKAARRVDIPFDDLCQRLVELAMQRA